MMTDRGADLDATRLEALHTYIADLEGRTVGLTLRVERLQRLWQAWGRAQGYALTSRRWTAFAEALQACEAAGDLLPAADERDAR